MRDLIITENITLDGVIDAAEGWFAPAGDEDLDQSDLIAALTAERDAADAFLVGRTTFEQMRGYWPQQTDDTTGISEYLNRLSKYVVSSTLEDPGWDRTTVLRGPLTEEIQALKSAVGADIVRRGGPALRQLAASPATVCGTPSNAPIEASAPSLPTAQPKTF